MQIAISQIWRGYRRNHQRDSRQYHNHDSCIFPFGLGNHASGGFSIVLGQPGFCRIDAIALFSFCLSEQAASWI